MLRLAETGGDGSAQAYRRSEHLLQESLQIDPDQPRAQHALASVYMRTGKTERAVTVLQRGIDLSPDSALLHGKLGYALRYAGMLGQSVAAYRLSQRLDPSLENLVNAERQIVKAHIYAGNYEAAAQAYQSVLVWLARQNRVPDEKMQFYQGLAYFYAGDNKAAVAMFDAAIERDPGTLWSTFARAYRAAAVGDTKNLRALVAELERGNVSDGERRYRLAHLNALAGRADEALAHLTASARAGFFCLPYTRSDALLAPIAASDEFVEAVDYIRRRHTEFAAFYLQ